MNEEDKFLKMITDSLELYHKYTKTDKVHYFLNLKLLKIFHFLFFNENKKYTFKDVIEIGTKLHNCNLIFELI